MHAEQLSPGLDQGELGKLWRTLSGDPESPEHFELSEYGELVLSPRPTNRHQLVIAWVANFLRVACPEGLVLHEVGVHTGAGVRAPDLAWIPHARMLTLRDENPLRKSPPLIVEVLSPGNRAGEMAHKIRGYFANGTEEVIVIDLSGTVQYHHPDGVHEVSRMNATLKLPPELFS